MIVGSPAMIRRSRWRITGLGLLMISLGLVAHYFYVARSRERALDELRERVKVWGGDLFPLDHRGGLVDPIRKQIGRDLFQRYFGGPGMRVRSNNRDASKEQLAELLGAVPFRQVFLGGQRNLDDDWIAGIDFPGSIIELNIGGTGVTDRSVSKILEMRELYSLDLAETSVSDEAIARLRVLPKIRMIYSGGPKIRAIRLIEGGVFDSQGSPALHPRASLYVRGKVRVDRSHIPGTLVHVMVRTARDLPSGRNRSAYYYWGAQHMREGPLIRTSDGAWGFDVEMNGLPVGRSSVEVWVQEPGERGSRISYRLPPFPLELSPEEPSLGGDGVAAPPEGR
jgi:hypothetical protein